MRRGVKIVSASHSTKLVWEATDEWLSAKSCSAAWTLDHGPCSAHDHEHGAVFHATKMRAAIAECQGSLARRARVQVGGEGGGLRNTIVCRSTVSRGHFRTGTHGHLRLSHVYHDLVTFIGARPGGPHQVM